MTLECLQAVPTKSVSFKINIFTARKVMAEPIVCFSKGHGYGLGQVTQHSTYNFVVELESFSVGLQCVCHLGGGSCTLFMGQDLAGGDLKDSALTPCITQCRAAKLK